MIGSPHELVWTIKAEGWTTDDVMISSKLNAKHKPIGIPSGSGWRFFLNHFGFLGSILIVNA